MILCLPRFKPNLPSRMPIPWTLLGAWQALAVLAEPAVEVPCSDGADSGPLG